MKKEIKELKSKYIAKKVNGIKELTKCNDEEALKAANVIYRSELKMVKDMMNEEEFLKRFTRNS